MAVLNHGKYRARIKRRIQVNGVRQIIEVHVGYFATWEEAKRAEDDWWAKPSNVTYDEWLMRHKKLMTAGYRYVANEIPARAEGKVKSDGTPDLRGAGRRRVRR